MQKIINRIFLLIIVLLIATLAYKVIKPIHTVSTAVTTGTQNVGSMLDDVSAASQEKIHSIIKEYLLANPEVILEAIDTLQKRKMGEVQSKVTGYLADKKAEVEDSTSVPFMGNEKGDIVIVALYDYTCGYCIKGNNYLEQLVNLDKGVKVVLRPFPVLGEAANYAARIALAVHRIAPEKFQTVHNGLLNLKPMTKEAVENLLVSNDLKLDAIEEEIDKSEIKDTLNKSFEIAGNLHIQSVPTYILNGQLLSGALNLETLQNMISEIRAKANNTNN